MGLWMNDNVWIEAAANYGANCPLYEHGHGSLEEEGDQSTLVGFREGALLPQRW